MSFMLRRCNKSDYLTAYRKTQGDCEVAYEMDEECNCVYEHFEKNVYVCNDHWCVHVCDFSSSCILHMEDVFSETTGVSATCDKSLFTGPYTDNVQQQIQIHSSGYKQRLRSVDCAVNKILDSVTTVLIELYCSKQNRISYNKMLCDYDGWNARLVDETPMSAHQCVLVLKAVEDRLRVCNCSRVSFKKTVNQVAVGVTLLYADGVESVTGREQVIYNERILQSVLGFKLPGINKTLRSIGL